METKKLRSIEKIIEYVPEELIREILSHAQVKSLVQFKCVSKAWRNIVSDPTFINLHLNRAIQQNNDFSILLYNSNHIYSIHNPTSTTAATTEWPFPFSHEDYDYYNIVGSCDGELFIGLCVFALHHQRWKIE
ncbi:hypothetical protein Sjap_024063 [Stephania japonica]|uniref:F-box domain-containing protein n=1 Tax=Stephania japonica TaxID=461633 RepID=A0AAP0HNL3_9MAGN